MLIAFYPQAKQGNALACNVCLRLLERRSAMVGTDAPVKVDVVVEAAAAAVPRSTASLIAELDRIVAERRGGVVPGLLIEGDPPA